MISGKLRRARGLDQRRVERRERQLAAEGEFEVNGVVGGEGVAGRKFVQLEHRRISWSIRSGRPYCVREYRAALLAGDAHGARRRPPR